MSQFSDKELQLLKDKLKYLHEQEQKYGDVGINLRSKNTWVKIGRKFFGTALGTSGLITLLANYSSGDFFNILTSTLALTGGLYNLIFDGLDYDTKVQNFLKTSGEYHNISEKIKYLLVDSDINKDDMLVEIKNAIQKIDDNAIPL